MEANSEASFIDVPAFHVVAGNPARIIKKIEPKERDPTLQAATDEATIAAAAASSS